MSDIEAIRTSIKELGQARKDKERKLKAAVKKSLANRQTQRAQPTHPA